jgi:hypothetical protein
LEARPLAATINLRAAWHARSRGQMLRLLLVLPLLLLQLC